MFLVVRVKADVHSDGTELVELDLSQAFLCGNQTQVTLAKKKLKRRKRGQGGVVKTMTLLVERVCEK